MDPSPEEAVMEMSPSSLRFARWTAVATAALAIAYAIPQVAVLIVPLPAPWDEVVLFAPSLLLAVCVVPLLAAVAAWAPPGRRVFGLAALAFAAMYAVLVSLVYFVQLAVVAPAVVAGEADGLALMRFGEGTFMTAVDALGYGMLSLSTLLAAPVFASSGPERVVRRFLLANGALAPVIVLAFNIPVLLAVGALWMVTMPGSAIVLARHFAREERKRLEAAAAPASGNGNVTGGVALLVRRPG